MNTKYYTQRLIAIKKALDENPKAYATLGGNVGRPTIDVENLTITFERPVNGKMSIQFTDYNEYDYTLYNMHVILELA